MSNHHTASSSPAKESESSLDQIYESLLNYKGPRYEDFPAIDLYMDQVVELLNSYLAPLYFTQKPPYITPSMINNYVKSSIVSPPHKKRYKAYHLAFLYDVMVLKQCFTLQEIASLITIYTEIESGERRARDFNRFVETLEQMLHSVMQNGDTAIEVFENPNWQQILMVDVLRAAACRLYGAYVITRYNKNQKDGQIGNK